MGRHQRFLEWDEVELPDEPADVVPEPAPAVLEAASAMPEERAAEDALYGRLQELLGQLSRCY